MCPFTGSKIISESDGMTNQSLECRTITWEEISVFLII